MYWGWITRAVILAAFLTLVVVLGVWWYMLRFDTAETRVVFLSVGQGDAILISQGMNQIVIDGGRDGQRLLTRLGRYIPFYDRTIETLIPTHPDADHIGGLSALLERYRVKTVLDTGARTDTRSAFLFYRDVEREGAQRVPAVRGTTVELPLGGTLSVLFPFTPLPADMPETNEGSVVARFTFGETGFLFMGDLPDEEQFIPEIGEAEVLKVAHHGSRYSTSTSFLNLVKPKTAIVSVGKNTYGHPAQEVLDRLGQRNITVARTDIDGDIVYRCRENTCTREE